MTIYKNCIETQILRMYFKSMFGIKVDKERYSTPALGGKMRGVGCFKWMTSQIFCNQIVLMNAV